MAAVTETWARILTHEASEYEESLARQGSRGTWDFPDDLMAAYAKRAKDLRRLASLLEQITPEMVERVSDEGAYQFSDAEGADTSVGELLCGVADLLRALSTAPTEETD